MLTYMLILCTWMFEQKFESSVFWRLQYAVWSVQHKIVVACMWFPHISLNRTWWFYARYFLQSFFIVFLTLLFFFVKIFCISLVILHRFELIFLHNVSFFYGDGDISIIKVCIFITMFIFSHCTFLIYLKMKAFESIKSLR